MASNNSNGIILGGAAIGVVLLGGAWMYAASTSADVEREAAERARNAEPLMIQSAVETSAETAEAAGDAVAETAESAAEGMDGAVESASDAASEAMESAEQAAGDAVESAEAAVESASDAAAEAVESAEQAAGDAVESAEAAVESASDAASEAVESAEQAAGDAVATVDETAGEAAQVVEERAETAAATLMAAAPMTVEGDVERGETVFRRCSVCHEVGEGAENGIGPHLNGVLGRAAGSVSGYDYSAALAGSGLTWTPDALNAYLDDPEALVEGTKSAFPGMSGESDKNALIAYLATHSTGDAVMVAPPPAADAGAAVEDAAETAAAETEAAAEEAMETAAETGAAVEETVETAAAETEAAAEEAMETAAETGAAVEDAAETAAAETEAAAEEAMETAAETGAAVEEAAETAAAETEAAVAGAAAVAAAAITGDADEGAKVFRKCQACHMIGDKAKNRTGPMLTGVVGREIGSVEDFRYSGALSEANEAGKVWTVDELTAYLNNPRKAYPGTRMAFAGLRDDDDIKNVIAYLATFE